MRGGECNYRNAVKLYSKVALVVQTKTATELCVAKSVKSACRFEDYVYRYAVLVRKGLKRGDMVVMLVRDEYRVKRVRIYSDALECRAERACAFSRVDKKSLTAYLKKC